LGVDTREAFREATDKTSGKISTGWLTEFNDPRMTGLVREAIANNRDLKASAERMRIAEQGAIIGGAARLPSINASTAYSRTYNGLGPRPGRTTEAYALQLNASWEIDLWGRLRDLDEAAYADYEAAVADYRGARLSLAAAAARGWINLVTAEQQLDLAVRTLEIFTKSDGIIVRRYEASLLRPVDVRLSQSNLAAAERNLESRTTDRNEAKRTLELLLSRYPGADLASSAELPELRRAVPVGLPSELLNRRPDLVAAQFDVYSSAKRADAARKNLLPSISLTGSGRNASDRFREVIDPGYLAWTAASSLAQTVYQGGAPSAQARAALARNRQAIETFAQDVLIAFREVESALEAEASLREQERALLVEVSNATKAEEISIRELAEGIEGASVLEVLEAQRRAVNSQASLIRLKNDRLQNRIDLHLALGGDFDTLAK
jgi:NodT family efflux transporter outer membrane factor (OMF) lipoprotein